GRQIGQRDWARYREYGAVGHAKGARFRLRPVHDLGPGRFAIMSLYATKAQDLRLPMVTPTRRAGRKPAASCWPSSSLPVVDDADQQEHWHDDHGAED